MRVETALLGNGQQKSGTIDMSIKIPERNFEVALHIMIDGANRFTVFRDTHQLVAFTLNRASIAEEIKAMSEKQQILVSCISHLLVAYFEKGHRRLVGEFGVHDNMTDQFIASCQP